jgi:hypothetical protein
MEISQDLAYRPIVFIRFNPDSYIDEDGYKFKSCWKTNGKGILTLNPDKKQDWNTRLDSLKDYVEYWIDEIPEKCVTIESLYFDKI